MDLSNPRSSGERLKQSQEEFIEMLSRLEVEELLVHRQPMKRHDLVESMLRREHQVKLGQRLERLHPADIADILESLTLNQRKLLWNLMEPAIRGQVLLEVSDAVRMTLISEMPEEALADSTEHLDTDEIADLAPDLPKKVMRSILKSLNDQKRKRLQEVLAYPENTVGALMDFGMVTIRDDVSLKAVSRFIRKIGKLPDQTDKLFVVDRNNVLCGILPLGTLLTSRLARQVSEVMVSNVVCFAVDDKADEATRAFERYNLISAPVVDGRRNLVGRLCVDAVMDFMHEEADEELLKQAGLQDEEDLFSGVWASVKNRWAWLMINILTAFTASRVIGLFENTILQLVALASLMPVVAAIGGNTGNQTSTLIVRSLALGHITPSNVRRLIIKELIIGLLNGAVWGSIVGLIVFLIYSDPPLGAVMAGAMLLNLLVAAVVGISIPLIRDKLGKDPALGTSVMLTFLTDAMGFLIFLGMASLFLL
ncbi:MAG: magnesium transporter [Methylococcaceae bacterium]|nr:magnesium transporter [Methylococcaceae bacterium]MCI0734352.1 magnesium transporter [Methylococcaceae bacterium]